MHPLPLQRYSLPLRRLTLFLSLSSSSPSGYHTLPLHPAPLTLPLRRALVTRERSWRPVLGDPDLGEGRWLGGRPDPASTNSVAWRSGSP
ncbi:hypothetical protein [Oryza sativa Japonica Group]|uniref:Uncharacterized protein P0022F12.22 n=1 Tax=Oryza sativa subsp. japonica TaxID=39947 RepID=Q657A8_ORYSJ|nr:hypothetical protein [Oryza sativa Japonica Group]